MFRCPWSLICMSTAALWLTARTSPRLKATLTKPSFLTLCLPSTRTNTFAQTVELFLAGSETESAAESVNSVYDEWIGMWIDRDIDGFTAAHPKDEAAMTEDELNSKLFGERDDNMSAYVKNLLDAQDGTTSLVVVGAGRMIGETGIVQQLLDAGYTVAPRPRGVSSSKNRSRQQDYLLPASVFNLPYLFLSIYFFWKTVI